MNVAKPIVELNERALALQNSGLARRDALRQIIGEVESRMLEMDGHLGPHPFPLTHDFADGLYMRHIYMPAGMLIVGMLHRYSHFCIITKGDVSVLTDEGVMRVQAPYIFRSPNGAKRVLYMHTDTVWSTVHATQHTDVDEIENEIIAKDYAEVAGGA